MNIKTLIEKKKNFLEFSEKEILFFADQLKQKSDLGTSALVMAINMAGLSDNETCILAKAIAGRPADLSKIDGAKASFFSTGKEGMLALKLAAASVLASCGAKCTALFDEEECKILQSFEGIKTEFAKPKYIENVNKNNACFGEMETSDNFIKTFEELLEATGAEDCISLASSVIVAKIVAAGADINFLNIRFGEFCMAKTAEKARELAALCVSVCDKFAKKCVATITDANEPICKNMGGNLELNNAIELLGGDRDTKLFQLCKKICTEILIFQSGVTTDAAEKIFQENINNKSAFKKLQQIVRHQGGNIEGKLPVSPKTLIIQSGKNGFIESIDSEKLCRASRILAGNSFQNGLIFFNKAGDKVDKDSNVCRIFCNDDIKIEEAKELITQSFSVGKTENRIEKFISETVSFENGRLVYQGELLKQYLSNISQCEIKAGATHEEIKKQCDEAEKSGFFSVYVLPNFVQAASKTLKMDKVKICALISYPFGEDKTDAKILAAKSAIRDGADEIALVTAASLIKARKWDNLLIDIKKVNKVTKDKSLTVIFETSLLSDDEIVKACKICKSLGVQYIQTDSGFLSNKASPRVIKLIKKAVGDEISISACGNLRTADEIKELISAGAARIIAVNAPELARELKN